jgi:hypothetical protein
MRALEERRRDAYHFALGLSAVVLWIVVIVLAVARLTNLVTI